MNNYNNANNNTNNIPTNVPPAPWVLPQPLGVVFNFPLDITVAPFGDGGRIVNPAATRMTFDLPLNMEPIETVPIKINKSELLLCDNANRTYLDMGHSGNTKTKFLATELLQIIIPFLPINIIYSQVTLIDKEWNYATELGTTWREIARVNWPSMNEFLISAERSNHSNERATKKRKTLINNISAEIHTTKFWKDLVIARFTRDSFYGYELMNATRKMLQSEVGKRNVSEIEKISTNMKNLQDLYQFDQNMKSNKYIMFMWDSILYHSIEKDIKCEYGSTLYDFHVTATFLDHLFQQHTVQMSYSASSDANDYRDEECVVRIDLITFSLMKDEDYDDDLFPEIFEDNRDGLEQLCERVHLDQVDETDKPSLQQFDSFLKQFCFDTKHRTFLKE